MAEGDKYAFHDDMDEISGFGGEYEAACRHALQAALLYLDANPGEPLSAQEIQGVFGISQGNARLEAALKAGNDACERRFGPSSGLTGAMAHALTRILIYVQTNGWPAYCVAMRRGPQVEA